MVKRKSKIGHLDNIALYVWFGTCDLTAYDKQTRFISIKDQTNDTIQKVVNNCQEIAEIVKKYPEVKLTFLAIPPYSIHSWNLYQKHPDAEQFKSDDDILLKQIQELNQHIHYINSTFGTRTPNFSTDIQHRINTSNKNSKKKSPKSIQFSTVQRRRPPYSKFGKSLVKEIIVSNQNRPLVDHPVPFYFID